jgi:hypothetical protein
MRSAMIRILAFSESESLKSLIMNHAISQFPRYLKLWTISKEYKYFLHDFIFFPGPPSLGLNFSTTSRIDNSTPRIDFDFSRNKLGIVSITGLNCATCPKIHHGVRTRSRSSLRSHHRAENVGHADGQ